MEIYSRACSTFLFVIFTPGMFKLHNYEVGLWVFLLIHICFIGSTFQVRTIHWRERTNPARSLRAVPDCSPLGISVLLHFLLNCHLSFAFFDKFLKSRVLLYRLSNRFNCERMCYSSHWPRGDPEKSKTQYSKWKMWL